MDDTPKKAKSAAPGNGVPNAPRRPARAELVWEGKYDAAGRRAAPLRVALPFQAVETVNESVQERQASGKGGVGKTTSTAALGAALATPGRSMTGAWSLWRPTVALPLGRLQHLRSNGAPWTR
jgi:Mrp family chromosome partitioning ATPase